MTLSFHSCQVCGGKLSSIFQALQNDKITDDLCSFRILVFLSDVCSEDMNQWDNTTLTSQELYDAEADCYWCLCKVLDSIQENYTFAQPGVQKICFQFSEVRNSWQSLLSFATCTFFFVYWISKNVDTACETPWWRLAWASETGGKYLAGIIFYSQDAYLSMLTQSTAATTTGNRLLTVWVPLDKLSNASRDSVSSLSASMGTSRFHFERVARCMQGSTFLQTDHAYILWLSGYVCCWEQSSRWLYSILLRSTFTQLVYQVESYGFSGYHRFLATPADRELDTCGGNTNTNHFCVSFPNTDFATSLHLTLVGNGPFAGAPMEACSLRQVMDVLTRRVRTAL